MKSFVKWKWEDDLRKRDIVQKMLKYKFKNM